MLTTFQAATAEAGERSEDEEEDDEDLALEDGDDDLAAEGSGAMSIADEELDDDDLQDSQLVHFSNTANNRNRKVHAQICSNLLRQKAAACTHLAANAPGAMSIADEVLDDGDLHDPQLVRFDRSST